MGGLTILMIVTGQLTMAVRLSPAEGSDTSCRIGFSSSMFAEVNENDVKAATRAWIQVLTNERGIPIAPDISILSGIEDISRALRAREVDAVSLTAEEYWALRQDLRSTHVVMGLFDGRFTEEYVLLVHRGSGIEGIGDLRGRNVVYFLNQRMGLASPWIETLLLKAGQGRSSQFFGRTTMLNKLPRVILPVFFRQSDACVVTRRGFQTMTELNPQVGQQLKVIASSPELVPAGFFFRGDFSESVRDRAFAEFEKIHTMPAGQQALTVFQSGELKVESISVLNGAMELLDTHKRLCAAAGAPKTTEAVSESREIRAGIR
ncbi:MAG: phosphate/phosphite/phosphonate ABC transporter substrate-binding protein [Syntrophobacteraceae bacterium]|nr:phosphate/phosphite/phosphonate ABC transporter substrate-binding protein [Syntrophobacteraceae bacterium]